MSFRNQKKLSRIMLAAEIILYFLIAGAMAYAIVS